MKTTFDPQQGAAARLGLPSMSSQSVRSTETMLLASCIGLLALALWGPHVDLPDHYHAFADRRAWQFLPNALDVLSNLGFAAFGMLGLLRLREGGGVWTRSWIVQRQMAALFFLGLVLTALCSGYYHWQPDDAGLRLDRAGMSMAFAGLLGLVAADRVSDRAARALAMLVLVAGPVAASSALESLNQLPWAVLQFGGLVIMVWLALRKPVDGALPIRWLLIIVAYAVAKLLELGDLQVYEWSGHRGSGHSLKHLVASLAAWPVLAALSQRRAPQVPVSPGQHQLPSQVH